MIASSRFRLSLSRPLLASLPFGSFCQPQQRKRNLSARAGKEEKSWKELLSDAASLASTAISKVTTGIGQAISGSSSPTKSNKPTTSTTRSSPLTGSFSSSNPIANLVGRAVGGLVAGVVDQLGKQLESAAQESQRAYSNASAAIKRSSKVQRVLGGAVECGQIASQSMSSTNINGASSSIIDLSFQVFSASGKVALARVSSDGNKRMDIKLVLQDGTTVDVGASDEGSGGAIGGLVREEIIEAEFKDLPPKK